MCIVEMCTVQMCTDLSNTVQREQDQFFLLQEKLGCQLLCFQHLTANCDSKWDKLQLQKLRRQAACIQLSQDKGTVPTLPVPEVFAPTMRKIKMNEPHNKHCYNSLYKATSLTISRESSIVLMIRHTYRKPQLTRG